MAGRSVTRIRSMYFSSYETATIYDVSGQGLRVKTTITKTPHWCNQKICVLFLIMTNVHLNGLLWSETLASCNNRIYQLNLTKSILSNFSFKNAMTEYRACFCLSVLLEVCSGHKCSAAA